MSIFYSPSKNDIILVKIFSYGLITYETAECKKFVYKAQKLIDAGYKLVGVL